MARTQLSTALTFLVYNIHKNRALFIPVVYMFALVHETNMGNNCGSQWYPIPKLFRFNTGVI